MQTAELVERYARISEQVRQAEAAVRPLWIRGGGTLLAPAPAGTSLLDLGSLNELIAHARDDMTLTVQAGMTVAAMQAHAAAAGQELPLDVPFADRTTGGLIATDLSGPRRFSRGRVRDLLLGITVVGRHGEVFRAGGRVVKNVAGYDLCKLYTGSWGWLGAIVEATFRLVPRPEARAALAMPFAAPAAAESTLAALLRGSLRPASVDLLNGAAARALEFPTAPVLLMLGFEGLREEVDDQLCRGAEELGPSAVQLTSDQCAAYRRAAAEIPLAADVPVRLSLPSRDVAQAMASLDACTPTCPMIAQAADGVLYIGFTANDGPAARDATDEAARRGGSWLLLRGGRPDVQLPMLGPPREDWGLMRRIKAAIDPAGVFGRGSPFDAALSVHR